MLSVTFPVPAQINVVYENINNPEEKWHPMDALDTGGSIRFADDLALLHHTQPQMQEKTSTQLARTSTSRKSSKNSTHHAGRWALLLSVPWHHH